MDFDFLDVPYMVKFREFLRNQKEDQETPYQCLKLVLSPTQQGLATHLNRLYSRMVWGVRNSATNKCIRNDEKDIFDKWLTNSFWSGRVLEVGCGSGRITKYVAKYAKKMVAIDIEQASAMRASRMVRHHLNADVRHCDLLSLQKTERFTSILMMENIIGMIPETTERIRHYMAAYNLLDEGGIFIISFRTANSQNASEISYHLLPYRPLVPGIGRRQLFGVIVNWSAELFIKEIYMNVTNLKLISLVRGETRPAGGQMYSAVFLKL